MIELDLAGLLAVACEVAGSAAADDGLALLRPNDVEAVLAAARRAAADLPDDMLYGPCLSAAALLGELARAELLPGRAGRLALLATLQMLGLNGLEATLGPPATVRSTLGSLRSGEADIAEVAAWLAGCCSPAVRDQPSLLAMLSPLARRVVEVAAYGAGDAVRPGHLALALALEHPALAHLCEPAVRGIPDSFDAVFDTSQAPLGPLPLSESGRQAVAWAAVAAAQRGSSRIGHFDLLVGLLHDGPDPVAARRAVRLNRLGDGDGGAPARPAGAGRRRATLSERLGSAPVPPDSHSALGELRRRVHHRVIDTLAALLRSTPLDDPQLRWRVEEEVRAALAGESMPLTAVDRAALVRDVIDDVVGYGPISPSLADPDVTEIMVNGPDDIYVERFGKLEQVDARFLDEAHLRRVIDKIVSQVGRRIDEASPMVDARLPDGSRVNAVVHPLAVGGPFLTVRKFPAAGLSVAELIDAGAFDEHLARVFQVCVMGRLNVVVSGGTGTGKTTLLNLLSSFIPSDERVVVIEDAKELRLRGRHVLHLEARPPNIEGRGEVTIRDLVRNALRMRPDRIVVGECRSVEALDMLQAMNTGHDGSLTTAHANSPRDALSRIETMALSAGVALPVRAIREQMASALHLLVHLARFRDGSRRVVQVAEVVGMEGDAVVLQDLFTFDWQAGVDAAGRPLGHLRSTGLRPHVRQRLVDLGLELPPPWD